MTCDEVRAHVDRAAQAGAERWSDCQIAAHIVSCSECSQLIRERQSLHKSLQLVRESAGPVSESLDAAVLADYRHAMAERSAIPLPARRIPFALRWGVVAALLLVAIALAVLSTRRPSNRVAVSLPERPASTAVAAAPQTQSAQPQIRSARRTDLTQRRRPVQSGVHPAMRAAGSIPDEFRGLMFCDELSCNGGMDMIRVQLPASLVARPVSGFQPAGGAVNADVLIGPDGIARGIRIEE